MTVRLFLLACLLAGMSQVPPSIVELETGLLVSSAHAGGRGHGGGGGNSGGWVGGGRVGGESSGRGGGSNDSGSRGSARSESDTAGDKSGSASGGSGASGAASSSASSNDAGNKSSEGSGDASRRDGTSAARAEQPTGARPVSDKSGGSRGSGAASSGSDAPPPYTVLEALKRVIKSDPPPAQTSAPSPAAAAAPSSAPKATPKTATPPPRIAAAPIPDIGHEPHHKHEVLAVNLAPADLKRAKDKLGFTESQSVVISGAKIARLIPPPGMEAKRAQELLRNEITTAKFELNQIYRIIYKAATQPGQSPARRIEPAGRIGTANKCIKDRCAGSEVVGWNRGRIQACSSGLRVAVIDTDVDQQHPAFEGKALSFGTFVPQGRTPAPNWHGTGVLALLAGHPQGGTPGLIPNASFYVASVFFEDGRGSFVSDSVSLLGALAWISEAKVQVVNMSFAGPRDALVEPVIARMSAQGVVFVAAAGNEGPAAEPSFPAAYEQVVAVTAVSKDLRHFALANRGNHIDVAAPGVDIWTAVPGAKEGYHTGTSFAAPFVTAMLATIYAGSPHKHKDGLLAQFEAKDLGMPGRDPVYGRGLLVAPDRCQPEMVAAGASRAPEASVTPVAGPTNWKASIIAPSAGRASTISAGFR